MRCLSCDKSHVSLAIKKREHDTVMLRPWQTLLYFRDALSIDVNINFLCAPSLPNRASVTQMRLASSVSVHPIFLGSRHVKVFDHNVPTASLVEMLADVVVCVLAVVLAVSLVPSIEAASASSSSPTLLRAVAFAGLMTLLFSFAGLYRGRSRAIGLPVIFARALIALVTGTCIAYLALSFQGGGDQALRLVGYAFPILVLGIVVVRSLAFVARYTTMGARRVMIVGTGAEAQAVAADLGTAVVTRRSIVGFYPTNVDQASAAGQMSSAVVFPHGMSIDEVVRKYHVDEVIVAVREQRGGGVPMDQLLKCRIRGIPVLDLAAFFESAKGEVPLDSLKASWLVYGRGFEQGATRQLIKRLFDLVMSSLLLVMAAPIMVLAALAVRLESPGPIIYRQTRVGYGGRHFDCLKFRSMRNDAEKDGVARWATKNDARVTRVGAFMRKRRIDELPQLFSVLKGEMSLVGPRPERPTFVAELQDLVPYYDVRHCVKPGVTGWAQVRYHYGGSIDDSRRKHQFDLYYVKKNSLFLDLLILVETVSVVLFREGAL